MLNDTAGEMAVYCGQRETKSISTLFVSQFTVIYYGDECETNGNHRHFMKTGFKRIQKCPTNVKIH